MRYQTPTHKLYQMYQMYQRAETKELKDYRYKLLLDRAARGDDMACKYVCLIDASKAVSYA